MGRVWLRLGRVRQRVAVRGRVRLGHALPRFIRLCNRPGAAKAWPRRCQAWPEAASRGRGPTPLGHHI